MSEEAPELHADRALVPVEERQVEFYGDELMAVLVDDDGHQEVYVPIKPISDALGLAWPGQSERLRRDMVLSKKLRLISVTLINPNPKGGRPDTLCLPLKYLPGWLFGVNASRVRPELRDKILRYQDECYDVLFEAFAGRAMPADPSPNATALIQIRETALAIAELAQQQLEIDQRLTGRLDRAAAVVGELGRRVRVLEAQLSPAGALTDAQAADIKDKVLGLAGVLSETEPGTDHYKGVYNELHRRFRATSYKTIRQADYQAVLDFLDTWYDQVQAKGKG
jgi:hypothetical protein